LSKRRRPIQLVAQLLPDHAGDAESQQGQRNHLLSVMPAMISAALSRAKASQRRRKQKNTADGECADAAIRRILTLRGSRSG